MADVSTDTYSIPSANADVLEANAENFDTFSNSDDETYTDRGGVERKTLVGKKADMDDAISDFNTSGDSAISTFGDNGDAAISDFNTNGDAAISDFNTSADTALSTFDDNQTAAISAAGYTIAGNFTDGCTITEKSEAVYYAGDSSDNYIYQGVYAWTGNFSKTVTSGTVPAPVADATETGWTIVALGYTKQSGAVLLMGQSIDTDLTIPTGQNGLTVDAETADGVTVTISEGSTLVSIS